MKIRLLILLVVAVFFSCRKNVDLFEAYSTHVIEWPEVLHPKEIIKSTDAGQDSKIDLGNGNVLSVAANTMVDATGQTLSGQVNWVLVGIQKKADLIFAYLNSNVQNGLVENHHTLLIKAYANEHPAYLKSGHSISVQSPFSGTAIEQIFTLNGNASTHRFLWQQQEGLPVVEDSWEVNGQPYSGIKYQLNQLQWVAAGQVIPNAETSLCISFPEGFAPEKAKTFFVFKHRFVVAEVFKNSDTNSFCVKLPQNTEGNLIVLSQSGNRYFFFNQAVTLSGDTTINALPKETPLDNIVLSLNSL